MGGVDKAALLVGGVPLLDRVLTAAAAVCDRLVVVGPPRATRVAGVRFVSEAEPGGGPAPAVLAGLDAAPDCDRALVMATDLPLLTSDHLRRLLAALDRPGVAAAARDRRGPNPLLAAYDVASLRDRARAATVGPGSAASDLLPPSVATVDVGAATVNVNRPHDLAAAELLAAHDERVVLTTQWLRDLVTTTVPDAVESIDRGFHYRHPETGSGCAVIPGASDVKLAFPPGGPDLAVRAPGDPPADDVVELVRRTFSA